MLSLPGADASTLLPLSCQDAVQLSFAMLILFYFVILGSDNDQMIGSKNKPKGDILASMKRQSLFENRHARCKVTPRPVAADGSISTRTSLKEVPDGKGDLRTRQRTVITDSNLRLNLQKGKPKSVKDRVTE